MEYTNGRMDGYIKEILTKIIGMGMDNYMMEPN